jgi:hypothetical protein
MVKDSHDGEGRQRHLASPKNLRLRNIQHQSGVSNSTIESMSEKYKYAKYHNKSHKH